MFKKVYAGEVLEQPLLIVDGWIEHPDFIRIDGIADKVYSQANSGDEGLACHSVVGEEADTEDGIPNRFLSTEKVNGRYTAYSAASCMFILRKRMPHVQMYPITASTWTSGSAGANCSTWAMEGEGGPPSNTTEPLTTHQENGFLIIATAWEQQKLRGCEVGKTARAHKDLVKVFGGNPTACESGRYRNAWQRLTNGERWVAKEEGMTTEYEDLLIAVFSGSEEKELSREQRLANAVYRRDEIVQAKAQSVSDNARSAYALAQAATPPPRVITITGTNMEVTE